MSIYVVPRMPSGHDYTIQEGTQSVGTKRRQRGRVDCVDLTIEPLHTVSDIRRSC